MLLIEGHTKQKHATNKCDFIEAAHLILNKKSILKKLKSNNAR